MAGCGVCGSNLPVWEGRPWFSYPLEPGAPGHEGWGSIEAVGAGVAELRPGDRVAFLSGQALASHVFIATDDVVPLPEEAPDTFPGEALACVMNIFERAEVRAAERVAVVGIGFLGGLLVQLCARAGAEVTAISRRDPALEVARAMGASIVLSSDDAAAAARVAGTFDRVFEMAGLQQTLDVASSLVRTRGRLIIGGYHQDGVRTVDMQSWNWRGIDVINAHERDQERYRQGLRAAIKAVSSGVLDPQPLYTHHFPLERAGDAFELLRARPRGFMKALVLP